MSTRIFCNACGKECDAPLRDEWYRTRLHLPKGNFYGHLCEGCADWLTRWFKGQSAMEEDLVAASSAADSDRKETE